MSVPTDGREYPRAAYAWYVVGVLLLAGITSYLDRYLLALLVTPIREQLGINDTQISLLQGLAFAVFYIAFGMPLGSLVDRFNRRNILAVGVLVWSLFTAACGLAETYTQLFIARLGVGIGEACLGPAAYSLICDYFRPQQRGRAMSVYNLANYLGGGGSLLIGGMLLKGLSAAATMNLPLLANIPAWKGVFFLAAAPGVVISLMLLTVQEVPRRQVATRAAVASGIELGSYLRQNGSVYVSLYTVFTSIAFVGLTFAAWGPTFFHRQFNLTPAAVGLITGPIGMVFGTIGALSSGAVGDWLVARGGTRFRIPIVAWPLILAGVVLLCTAPNLPSALVAEAILSLGGGLGLVAGPPTFQDVTPNQLRGRVQALYFMLSGVLGLGLAPTVIALVTDFVFRDAQAIRYSLLVVLAPVAGLGFTVSLLGQKGYRALHQGFLICSHGEMTQ